MMLERRHLLLVAIIVVVCGFFAVIDAVDNDNTGRIDNMSCENFQHDGECSIGKDGTIKNAMGGTEIMHDGLLSRLPQIYRDNFSFSASTRKIFSGYMIYREIQKRLQLLLPEINLLL
jgi:hypothetical protein